jgi:hypothetical protein
LLLSSSLIALKMGTRSTSETSVNLYLSTRRYNPEESHHIRRFENLKFYAVSGSLFPVTVI